MTLEDLEKIKTHLEHYFVTIESCDTRHEEIEKHFDQHDKMFAAADKRNAIMAHDLNIIKWCLSTAVSVYIGQIVISWLSQF